MFEPVPRDGAMKGAMKIEIKPIDNS